MSNLEIDGTDLNEERTIGFIKITNLGKAQQVTVDNAKLAKIVRFLASLKDLGFEKITITVQKDKPVIFGGKTIGIGLAPVIEDDET